MLSKEHVQRNKLLSLIYRFTTQFFDVGRLARAPGAFLKFLSSYVKYRQMEKTLPAHILDWQPEIHDRTAETPFDPHYFYQSYWAFKRIVSSRVTRHLDVASQVDLLRYLSAIMQVTFVDIRPLRVQLENCQLDTGSIVNLPYPDGAWQSVSCLHVIEHIGLGRYGDLLDPFGSQKAAGELTRVLSPGGVLYLSTPIGKPRVCFNAHRVRSPRQVISLFPELALEEFSVIDDSGSLIENTSFQGYESSHYACGLFRFRRKKNGVH